MTEHIWVLRGPDGKILDCDTGVSDAANYLEETNWEAFADLLAAVADDQLATSYTAHGYTLAREAHTRGEG